MLRPKVVTRRMRLTPIAGTLAGCLLVAACGGGTSLGEATGTPAPPEPNIHSTRSPEPATSRATRARSTSHDPSTDNTSPAETSGPTESTPTTTDPNDIAEQGDTGGRSADTSTAPETTERTDAPAVEASGGNLECDNCPTRPLGIGFDSLIPGEVPLPDPRLTIEQVNAWETSAGAVHTGNLNSVGFTNTSSTDVIEIESVTMAVFESTPLPVGYCARMPPRGGAGDTLPLEFDFESDRSAGRPGVAQVASDEWTFPLSVPPGTNVGFEMLGDRPAYVVSFGLEFEFRQGGYRYTRVVGTPDQPFGTSSCSAATAYYVWRSEHAVSGEVFTLTQIPFPTTRDPFRRDTR